MPVAIVPAPVTPVKTIFDPDVGPPNPFPQPFAVKISQEPLLTIPAPADFALLPPEQQALLMNEYRFGGIRLRGDIEQKINITRNTLDIP